MVISPVALSACAREEAACDREPFESEPFVEPRDFFQTSRPGRTEMARQIRDLSAVGLIELLPRQVSGRDDGADARSNIFDSAEGKRAKRSSYGRAPGGSVALDTRLLSGILELADEYRFRITSIAGGSHSSNSRHYAGIAFDVDRINGCRVNRDHQDFRAFLQKAREMGATEVLGPGDPGHSTHLHMAWPRR